MTTLLTPFLLAASLLSSSQPAQNPSILDGLKQFEGHWKGVYPMESVNMDVDLNWKRFDEKWVEVSYTYTAKNMSLDYKVMMAANPENKGFYFWMFGNDVPIPDPMTGRMEGKTLVVVHGRGNEPDVKFWIDEKKNMVMSILNSVDNSEIGKATLTPAKK